MRRFFTGRILRPWFGLLLAYLALIILLLVPFFSKAQNQQLNYNIIQGGDEIGWMRLNKNVTGNTSNLLMVSEIRKRIIFLINVTAKESAVFESGRLIFSSQFRKKNGNVNLDKQTRFTGKSYEVLEDGAKEELDFQFIGTNLLSLYFNEPVDINFVYCDNHKRFLNITKTEDGGYKVKFPDGNSNCYYYNNGTCSRIKVKHTFYSADIILNP